MADLSNHNPPTGYPLPTPATTSATVSAGGPSPVARNLGARVELIGKKKDVISSGLGANTLATTKKGYLKLGFSSFPSKIKLEDDEGNLEGKGPRGNWGSERYKSGFAIPGPRLARDEQGTTHALHKPRS